MIDLDFVLLVAEGAHGSRTVPFQSLNFILNLPKGRLDIEQSIHTLKEMITGLNILFKCSKIPPNILQSVQRYHLKRKCLPHREFKEPLGGLLGCSYS